MTMITETVSAIQLEIIPQDELAQTIADGIMNIVMSEVPKNASTSLTNYLLESHLGDPTFTTYLLFEKLILDQSGILRYGSSIENGKFDSETRVSVLDHIYRTHRFYLFLEEINILSELRLNPFDVTTEILFHDKGEEYTAKINGGFDISKDKNSTHEANEYYYAVQLLTSSGIGDEYIRLYRLAEGGPEDINLEKGANPELYFLLKLLDNIEGDATYYHRLISPADQIDIRTESLISHLRNKYEISQEMSKIFDTLLEALNIACEKLNSSK